MSFIYFLIDLYYYKVVNMFEDDSNRKDEHKTFWKGVTDYDQQVFSVFADKDAENPIFDYLKKKPRHMKVADLGCGSGNFEGMFLSDYFDNVIAVDYSESQLKQAKYRQLSNVEYALMDMKKLPFNESLDIAVSVNSVLPGTVSEVEKMFKEIYNSLKPGGEFVGILPSAEAAIHLAFLDLLRLLDEGVDEATAMKQIEKVYHGKRQFSIIGAQRDNENSPRQIYHYPFTLEVMLKRAGFEIIESGEVHYSHKYCKNHDYGIPDKFDGMAKPIWDLFMVARKPKTGNGKTAEYSR